MSLGKSQYRMNLEVEAGRLGIDTNCCNTVLNERIQQKKRSQYRLHLEDEAGRLGIDTNCSSTILNERIRQETKYQYRLNLEDEAGRLGIDTNCSNTILKERIQRAKRSQYRMHLEDEAGRLGIDTNCSNSKLRYLIELEKERQSLIKEAKKMGIPCNYSSKIEYLQERISTYTRSRKEVEIRDKAEALGIETFLVGTDELVAKIDARKRKKSQSSSTSSYYYEGISRARANLDGTPYTPSTLPMSREERRAMSAGYFSTVHLPHPDYPHEKCESSITMEMLFRS